jgi:hypothetical protein
MPPLALSPRTECTGSINQNSMYYIFKVISYFNISIYTKQDLKCQIFPFFREIPQQWMPLHPITIVRKNSLRKNETPEKNDRVPRMRPSHAGRGTTGKLK